MQAAPQTTFSDLMAIASGMLRAPSVSEFELKRLSREIAKLKVVDKGAGLELEGYIAAIRDDANEAHRCFERALLVTKDFNGCIVRHILVLSRIGDSKRVREVFERHRQALQGDVSALRVLREALAFSGWLLIAQSIAEDLSRMGISVSTEQTGDAVTFEANFSEEEVAEPVAFSNRYLRARGMSPTGLRTTGVVSEDGTSTILFELDVPGTPEVVAEAEWDMFGALDEANFAAEQARFVSIALRADRSDHNACHAG